MFIEPTIIWVPSGFSGYIWPDTKIVLKKTTATMTMIMTMTTMMMMMSRYDADDIC